MHNGSQAAMLIKAVQTTITNTVKLAHLLNLRQVDQKWLKLLIIKVLLLMHVQCYVFSFKITKRHCSYVTRIPFIFLTVCMPRDLMSLPHVT